MSKIYTPIGASNHCKDEREINDFYATDPTAIDWLFKVEKFQKEIWEPAAGMGHLSKRMIELGHNVFSTDLIDRGYSSCIPNIDFLSTDTLPYDHWEGDIITNPPYSKGLDFVERALELVQNGSKVAMFLKLTFLEGKARRQLYEKYPPAKIWVFSSRIPCAKNGDFDKMKEIGGSAVAYAWFVWEKGYCGKPFIGWIN